MDGEHLEVREPQDLSLGVSMSENHKKQEKMAFEAYSCAAWHALPGGLICTQRWSLACIDTAVEEAQSLSEDMGWTRAYVAHQFMKLGRRRSAKSDPHLPRG